MGRVSWVMPGVYAEGLLNQAGLVQQALGIVAAQLAQDLVEQFVRERAPGFALSALGSLSLTGILCVRQHDV